MNIYIDFDHTISPNGYTYLPQKMELPPIAGAVEAIQGFMEQGHTIIIFSCRANKDVVGDDIVELKTKEMTDYLNRYFIPYDKIFKEKPNYDIVIDDKAIGFNNNWLEIKKAIKG